MFPILPLGAVCLKTEGNILSIGESALLTDSSNKSDASVTKTLNSERHSVFKEGVKMKENNLVSISIGESDPLTADSPNSSSMTKTLSDHRKAFTENLSLNPQKKLKRRPEDALGTLVKLVD